MIVEVVKPRGRILREEIIHELLRAQLNNDQIQRNTILKGRRIKRNRSPNSHHIILDRPGNTQAALGIVRDRIEATIDKLIGIPIRADRPLPYDADSPMFDRKGAGERFSPRHKDVMVSRVRADKDVLQRLSRLREEGAKRARQTAGLVHSGPNSALVRHFAKLLRSLASCSQPLVINKSGP